jgi:biotin transport system substrate-specific component
VTGIVGFALLTALGSQIRLYVWEVPFTLQTLAVYGSGLYLGARNGLLSQLLYLTLGFFLPVYAGAEYGPAALVSGITAGYLLGFPVAAFVSGLASDRWRGPAGSFVSLALGSIALFAIGVTWFHVAAGHATWFESIDRGWLRFVGVDIAKILLVSLIYSGSRRATAR